jgi:GNAT superfamily N-acetyltransferase
MLRPAIVTDLPILRALIREGAMTGSFDRDLATDSREAGLFFTNLRQALASGYFVEENPRTGELATVAAPGFVYLPDGEIAVHRPIGFGLFKAMATGYELWLTGIDAAWRGHGHGRAMLKALLDTQPGRRAFVVRVKTRAPEADAMSHLLASFGYTSVREAPQHTWFLRSDAPAALRAELNAPPVRQTAA